MQEYIHVFLSNNVLNIEINMWLFLWKPHVFLQFLKISWELINSFCVKEYENNIKKNVAVINNKI